mmetsp:Transcript_28140/g.66130  ORF Transcript_28140/g.66130 Transcript_28140/m.66130 type:complete len:212 (+) Transcript_28140:410-1045(+)
MMKSLLVADHLQGDAVVRLEIKRADDLPKGTFAQWVQHLVAVQDVVVQDNHVIATLVVVRVVICRCRRPPNFWSTCTEVPDLREVQNLPLLELCQLLDVMLEHLRWAERNLQFQLFFLALLLSFSFPFLLLLQTFPLSFPLLFSFSFPLCALGLELAVDTRRGDHRRCARQQAPVQELFLLRCPGLGASFGRRPCSQGAARARDRGIARSA